MSFLQNALISLIGWFIVFFAGIKVNDVAHELLFDLFGDLHGIDHPFSRWRLH